MIHVHSYCIDKNEFICDVTAIKGFLLLCMLVTPKRGGERGREGGRGGGGEGGREGEREEERERSGEIVFSLTIHCANNNIL